MDDQPFSAVEHVVFELLIEHLEPRYMLPNQQETAGPHLFTVVSGFLSQHSEHIAEFNSWQTSPTDFGDRLNFSLASPGS